MFSHIKKLDWILASYAVLLVSFGLISLYSTSVTVGDLLVFKKQLLWLSVGVIFMVLISFLDYRMLKNYKIPVLILFITSCVLLIGLFFFGTPIRGTLSWYRLGPVAFEPVEVAKIALIVVLAKYFSMRHIEMYRFRHIFISGIYMAILASIVLFQNETGSVIVLGSIWMGIMIIAGIKFKHLFVLGLTGVLIMAVAWTFLFQDFQRNRVMSFLSPESDPQGAGYNALQSVIAVGSGGIWGKGIGEGSQTQLGFLPEAQTDFIYSALIEEIGLIGAVLILLCFILLVRRIMAISRKSDNNFARLVAVGFSTMLLSQIFVNIGMAIGLFPITGIPLPFVSYGGSSLISLFMILGIIQSIKVNS